MLDRVGLGRRADVTVQHRDVVFHHHVHMRYVEALQEAADRRTNAVGEDVVADVRIRRAARQPVEDSGRGRDRVADIPRELRGEPPDRPAANPEGEP